MSSNVVEIINSVVGELKEIARSETIIGEPVTIGDKTVVPVVKISVGFGVGGGEKRKDGGAHAGAGGGGCTVTPAAFIIMDDDGISLLPATRSSWEGLIQAIPGIAGKIANLRNKAKTDDTPPATEK